MTIRTRLSALLIGLSFFYFTPAPALEVPLGQTLQINTRFLSIAGKPTWTLIIRDMTNGQVLPYVFDVWQKDNFWVAFTVGHSYRITVSDLKFTRYAIIHNFCNLEDGVLSGKSMIITLTGNLTPIPCTAKCHILKYSDFGLPIANQYQ